MLLSMADNQARLQQHAASRVGSWVDTDSVEIQAFLALLINMGLVTKNRMCDYWSQQYACDSTPWFATVMSRNRFQLLLKFVHLVDNTRIPAHGQPGYDPTDKFKPLVEYANRKFKRHYTLHREISIDERLVGCLNRSGIIQYLPNKHHHRFGVKLWMLCDSTSGYTHSFEVYRGRHLDHYVRGQGYEVCMRLLQKSDALNKAHSLVVDNFFTDMNLGSDLLVQNTYLTGTVRRNRRGVPKKVVAKKLPPMEQFAMRSGERLVVSWREKQSQKKSVLLYSTCCGCSMENVTTSRHRQKTKPAVVSYYNQFMGGVDMSDMMLYCYLDERKSLKMWKKVFLNLIGRMMLNAWIIHKENQQPGTSPKEHVVFLKEVVQGLAAAQIDRRKLQHRQPVQGDGDGPHLRRLPEKRERDCCVCSDRERRIRRRSRTICDKCGKGLHRDCAANHHC